MQFLYILLERSSEGRHFCAITKHRVCRNQYNKAVVIKHNKTNG